jgi:hypothetical protein
MTLYGALYYSSIYSTGLPTLIGLWKHKHIPNAYYPFLIYCAAAVCSAILSQVFIHLYGTNAINYNIYMLIDFILALCIFTKWDDLKESRGLIVYIAVGGTAIWTCENLILSRIIEVSSVTLITLSLSLIYLSVDQINYIVVTERKNILKNAKFIICIGFLIYYGVSVVLEIFSILKLNFKEGIGGFIAVIVFSLILLVNIIYAFATLCIQKKQKFTLPS